MVLSLSLGIVMGVAFWAVAFYDASVWLIIAFFSLANLSAFSLVWAIQPLCFSRHQSAIIFIFVFLVLLAPNSLIDQ